MFLALFARADNTMEIDGIWYSLISNTKIAVVINNPNKYTGNVVIPSSVNYNGLEYSVTSIGNGAFSNCSGLTSITIPNSVTSIGYAAFYDCTNLTSITIPQSVVSIGATAFKGTAWYNKQPDGLIYAGKVVLKYKGTISSNAKITLDEGTLGIADNAFEGSSITSIIIPTSVINIGSEAFRSSRLVSITIPNSVIKLGHHAFYSCSQLASVTISNSLKEIESDSFAFCVKLSSVTIPKSVISIGYMAFWQCIELKTITIPNSVTSIDLRAFSGTAWEDNLPNGLVYVGKVAYKFKGSMPDNTTITLEEGTISIASGAFSSCSGLTSITIPNSVKHIGRQAFMGCRNLTSITIPNNVTTIGSETFSGCSCLTSILIGIGVSNIGQNAFYGNDLGSIKVENGNKVFDSRNDCNAIIETATNKLVLGCKKTVIPNSVTGIGESAFQNCFLLKSINIPNSVTTIGNYAFKDCFRLKSITIPNSITNIGAYAFGDCDQLKTVYSYITEPTKVQIQASSFSNIYLDFDLYVPKGTKHLYETIDGWNVFPNIFEIGVTKKSDVNEDGSVDVADISSVISFMSNRIGSKDRNDVNDDGTVDVADISSIITMMRDSSYDYLKEKGNQTVLVYVAGDNNLTSNGHNYLTTDLKEMMKGSRRLDENDNLILFIDEYGRNPYFLKLENGDTVRLESMPLEVKSSNAETLYEAMKYAQESFPADSYGLVLWGIADSWLIHNSPSSSTNKAPHKAFGLDNTEGRTWMDILDMARALERLPKLKFIFADCGNFLCVENVYELRKCADYIIGSAAEIPAEGAPYQTVVPAMFSQDSTFYKHVVRAYFAQTSNGYKVPLAAVKTSELDNLASTTAATLQSFANHIELDEDGCRYPDVSDLIFYYDHTQFDMQDFMLRFASEAQYKEWKRVFDKAVPYHTFTTVWMANHVYPSPYNEMEFADFTITEERLGAIGMYVPQTDADQARWNRFYQINLNKSMSQMNSEIKQMQWYHAAQLDKMGW